MDSRRTDPQAQRPPVRLTLLTQPVEHAVECARIVAEALDAADIAAVVVRLAPGDERTLINRIKTVAPPLQARGVAVLVDGHFDLVARGGADGAHLTGIAALKSAIGGLQPERIAGAGGLKTRHDAMLAGEAGADYVMFGEPDSDGRRPALPAVRERIAWWAEIFQPPCVGFAGSLDEVRPLAEAGADFVALGDWVWSASSGAVAAVAAAACELAAAEQPA